jgi:hypothetical protein
MGDYAGAMPGCDIRRPFSCWSEAWDRVTRHRLVVVLLEVLKVDRIEIGLVRPSAPGSTMDIYRRVHARLRRGVMLTVHFTERRILQTGDGGAGP